VRELAKVNADTADLQNQLWLAVRSAAASQQTPVMALAVSGMNDVLSSQGNTQAAWWNRIPTAAWVLRIVIAICCNLLLGYGARRTDRRLSIILPLAASLSFLLISDIDSPRRGYHSRCTSESAQPRNLFVLGDDTQRKVRWCGRPISRVLCDKVGLPNAVLSADSSGLTTRDTLSAHREGP
jgi:hypothetical protein